MSAEHTKHAETLVVDGVKYRLAVPWQQLPAQGQELRSIGPHYESEPPDPLFMFMPDIGYVEGLTDAPVHMWKLYKSGK